MMEANSLEMKSLQSETLILEPFGEHDIEAYLAWCNREKSLDQMGLDALDPEQFAKDVRHHSAYPPEERHWCGYVIRPREDREKLVGVCSLRREDLEDGEGEVGFEIASEYWGKGYATEAVGLLVAFAFKRARLGKLTAGTLKSNEAAQRVLEKVGFTVEGESEERLSYDLFVEEWEQGA